MAMTFDKNQTQEKPPDKSVPKGLSVSLWDGTFSKITIGIFHLRGLSLAASCKRVVSLIVKYPLILYFLEKHVHGPNDDVFSGCSETEEQLQFPLELCTDSASTTTQSSSRISGSLAPFPLLHDLLPCPVSLTGVARFLH